MSLIQSQPTSLLLFRVNHVNKRRWRRILVPFLPSRTIICPTKHLQVAIRLHMCHLLLANLLLHKYILLLLESASGSAHCTSTHLMRVTLRREHLLFLCSGEA